MKRKNIIIIVIIALLALVGVISRTEVSNKTTETSVDLKGYECQDTLQIYNENETIEDGYITSPFNPLFTIRTYWYSDSNYTNIYMADVNIDGVLQKIQIIDNETFNALEEEVVNPTNNREFMLLYAVNNKLPILLMCDKN